MAPERKYALSKIATGDYLLPSNDAQTMWRITKAASPTPEWDLYRWRGEMSEGESAEPENWEDWEYMQASPTTRQGAIDVAMGYEDGGPNAVEHDAPEPPPAPCA